MKTAQKSFEVGRRDMIDGFEVMPGYLEAAE